MNKLGKEKSPYLLQHKDNPVAWNAWGKEALDKAQEEGKLLFISIGYSTCHWCHVLNRQSFSDFDVADVLNEGFIPIKVDREERPDIDKVYMEFSQAMNGNGGWPLNIIATPDGKPLTIFTYLPKETVGRRIGIIEYLKKINILWRDNKEDLIRDSNLILEEVESIASHYNKADIAEGINEKAVNELDGIFDSENGGFGKSPKFPMPQYILYLLGLAEQGNERALDIAEITLMSMYQGGLFDHIGYGFFRYSVDEKWLVPHFEKMLYDNALLGICYTRAYEITGKEIYKEIAEKTYEFIIRDFLSPEGGYYSALDAESEGEEGKYYLFDKEEIIGLLDEEWGELFSDAYDISSEGNFEGQNIPNLIGKDVNKLDKSLESMIDMIQTYRETRTMPHRDEKILTSWNGLLIGSLAYAGRVFKNNLYMKRAVAAADFLIEKAVDKDSNLNGTYVGESYNLGYLDDYAFFVYGLLNLYEYNKEDTKYLDQAKNLMDKVFDEFEDKDGEGGLYFSGNRSEKLVLRLKDYYDGAIPSGIAFILLDLVKLHRITEEEEYMEKIKSLFNSFGGDINQNPLAYLYSLIAYNNFL
nr:thioredoxin domain-containing protein [Tissierella sp.]